jgi:hypothetical protein
MDDGKYDHLIRQRAEVDRVWEAAYQRPPYLALNTGVRKTARRIPPSALSTSVAKALPSPER